MSLDYGASVSQKGYDVKTCDDRFLVYSSAFQTLKIFSSSALTGTVPTGNSADFTANSSTEYLTSAGHGLSNGDQLNFLSDDTLPGGLTSFDYASPWGGEIYYVINKTTNTFQVSLTLGGSAVNITSTGTGTHTWYNDTVKIIYTHDLGYLAPFICVYNGSTTIGVATSYLMSDSEYVPLIIRQYTTKTEIYVYYPDGGTTVSGDTVYFTLHQFLDTFDTLSASSINTGTSSGASSTDYGIRISKAGYDVATCDDINCILSSSFFTHIVHMKGTSTGDGDPISVSHNLNYIPLFLSYIKYNGKTFLSPANENMWVTTTTLESYPDADDILYYIIFKNKSV